MIIKNVYTCQVICETYVLEHFLEFICYINSLITDVSLLQDIQYKVKAIYAKNMKLHWEFWYVKLAKLMQLEKV